MTTDAKKLKLTLTKSFCSEKKNHRATCEALGLRRMHQTVVVADNPATRGMVQTVIYMLQVEELN